MTQASALISAAQGYAATMLAAANSALGDAVSAASEIRLGSIIPGNVTLPESPPFGLGLTAPRLPPVGFDPPNAPSDTPQFQDIDAINPAEGKPADFIKTAPVPMPPMPPSALEEFRSSMSSLDLNVSFPDAPSIGFGVAPTLSMFVAPDRPNTTVQPFGGATPLFDAEVPTGLDTKMLAWYHTAAPEFITMINGYVDAELLKINPQYHAQMARIEAQLTKYLDGGTGLDPAVEEAIYNRGRARNDLEARKVQDGVFADTAARGFTLPSGAMASALARARQDAANNANKTSNEIIVMQAEMEQKNLQFAVTTSTGLRTTMLNATLSYMQNLTTINGQALEYAKSILSAIVATFESAVKAYSARVEGLRAEVTAYDAYLKGVMADLERYKAELAGEQTKAQIDLAKVQVYTAVIQGQQALVQAYKVQVEAEISKASLQKLKIEVFQAQVQAYSAQVQGKNAEWQGYTAAWSGENSKQAGFKAEVDAYTAKVQGYAAGISAKSAAAQAQAMTNKARAEQWVAELSGFSAAVEAASKVSTTELENNRQEIVAFQAEASAKVAELNSYIEYYKATGQIGMEQAKLDTSTLIAVAEHTQKQQALIAQLHTANATVHANLAGAAMAGMNALAVESATTTG